MASFDYNNLRAEADRALHGAPVSPRKLVTIHSAASIGLGLLLSVLSYLLQQGIAGTGGLSGIGLRTVMETCQMVLQLANTVLLPFWAVGYIRAVLQWTSWERTEPSVLLHGFRHWGPVLRLQLLRGAIYIFLMITGAQIASLIFLMTPAARDVYAQMEQLLASGITDPNAIMESEAYISACMAMAPYVVLGAVVFVVPLAYRLRFADYILMDMPRMGALRAMLASWHMTRRNCLALLKLDLHFWWFYLAQGLIAVLGYGDLLLPMLGVDLTINADAAMFGFYIAALVSEFALFVWQKNRVFTVYGLAYRQLTAPQEEPPQPQPKHVPWNY